MKLFWMPKTRSMQIIWMLGERCVAREACQRALAISGD
jgi:hypothetical protein